MENTEIELFIHSHGSSPKVAVGTAGETLRDLLVRLEVFRVEADGIHVFVGECVEALDEGMEVDDGTDTHQPVDVNLTLAILEVERHHHVQVHHCRHVRLEVNFGGKTKQHRFSPNTTVGVATDWSRRKFELDPKVASEYVLQICKTANQPRSDQHLGDLVHDDKCSLCFDLVKEITPRG